MSKEMLALSRRSLLRSIPFTPALCRAQRLGPGVAQSAPVTGNDPRQSTTLVTMVANKGEGRWAGQRTTIPNPTPPFNKWLAQLLGPLGIGSALKLDPPPEPPPPPDPPANAGPVTGVVTPSDIVIDGDPALYVLDTLGFLTSLDPSNLGLIAQLAIPGGGSFMALSPDGTSIYLSSPGKNQLVSIDRATFTIRSTLSMPAGSQPGRVLISPDSTTVYVVFWPTNLGAASPSGIYVINGAQNTITATISSPSLNVTFFDAEITPDGQLIYAMAAGTTGKGSAFAIDTGSNSVIATINFTTTNGSVPATNKFTAVHPTGRAVYFALNSDQIAVFDTGSNTLASKIQLSVPDGAVIDLLRLQVNSSGTMLFAQAFETVLDNQGDYIEHNYIFMIDTVLNQVGQVLDLGVQFGEGIVCFAVT